MARETGGARRMELESSLLTPACFAVRIATEKSYPLTRSTIQLQSLPSDYTDRILGKGMRCADEACAASGRKMARLLLSGMGCGVEDDGRCRRARDGARARILEVD